MTPFDQLIAMFSSKYSIEEHLIKENVLFEVAICHFHLCSLSSLMLLIVYDTSMLLALLISTTDRELLLRSADTWYKRPTL